MNWIDGQKCRRKCKGEIGRQEGNLSISISFGEIVQVHISRRF